MKSLLLIIPLLTACTVLPSSHSPTLYNHVVELSVLTTHASQQCGSPSVKWVADSMRLKADVVVKYTQYVSKDTHEVAVVLAEQYHEFADAYNNGEPSAVYCKLKTSTMVDMTDKVLDMLGSKPNE